MVQGGSRDNRIDERVTVYQIGEVEVFEYVGEDRDSHHIATLHDGTKVYITTPLLVECQSKQVDVDTIVNKGMELLKTPDPEDIPHFQMRVVQEGAIWVIRQQVARDVDEYTLNFMRPEDY